MEANTTDDRPTLWRGERLVLASKSRGRAEVLRRAGVLFDAVDSRLDERQVATDASLPPGQLAEKLAIAKAEAVSKLYSNRIVIGADQVLSFNDVILHKAESIESAKRNLRALRGKRHHLHSAMACVRDGELLFSFVEQARISMRRFDEDSLDAYAAAMGENLLRTVGGYEIEGLGANLIEQVEGDVFTVIGLPLLRLLKELRRIGVIPGESETP